MNELADLQTDEDVDRLMSRLWARIEPMEKPSVTIAGTPASGGSLADALAAMGEFQLATARAIRFVCESIDEPSMDAARFEVSAAARRTAGSAKPAGRSDRRQPARRAARRSARTTRRTR